MLWDLFGKEALRLEKTWNISLRLMLGLHRETHRYFLEPVSGTRHVMFNLHKRFLTFVQNIMEHKKQPMGILCNAVLADVRSTTGNNFRHLMLRYEAGSFKELVQQMKMSQEYKQVENNDEWKIGVISDLIEAGLDSSTLPEFTKREIKDLRDYISTC